MSTREITGQRIEGPVLLVAGSTLFGVVAFTTVVLRRAYRYSHFREEDFEAMSLALPEASAMVLDQARSEGLHHPILPRLHAALSERARYCAGVLGA